MAFTHSEDLEVVFEAEQKNYLKKNIQNLSELLIVWRCQAVGFLWTFLTLQAFIVFGIAKFTQEPLYTPALFKIPFVGKAKRKLQEIQQESDSNFSIQKVERLHDSLDEFLSNYSLIARNGSVTKMVSPSAKLLSSMVSELWKNIAKPALLSHPSTYPSFSISQPYCQIFAVELIDKKK